MFVPKISCSPDDLDFSAFVCLFVLRVGILKFEDSNVFFHLPFFFFSFFLDYWGLTDF